MPPSHCIGGVLVAEKRMKIRFANFPGMAVILLTTVGVCAGFLWREPGTPVTLGTPQISVSSYEVAITNVSDRLISYRMLPLQMKCNGVWMESGISSDQVIYKVSHRPTPIPVITWNISGGSLAPGRGDTIPGRVPRYISSPPGATAWRVAVEWSYSTPSKMEQWRTKAIRFLTRRPPTSGSVRHTNFTSELSF
jgi:hypothetical protein